VLLQTKGELAVISRRALFVAIFLVAATRYASGDLIAVFSSLDTQATRSTGGSYSYAPVAGSTILVGINGLHEFGGDLEFAWSMSVPSGAMIDSATLSFDYTQNSSSELSFDVFAHSYWITYSAPFDLNFNSSATPIASFVRDTRSFGQILIDVTSAVAEQSSLGQQGIGFALKPNFFTNSQFGFASSGVGPVSMQPRLDISFTPIPEASPPLIMGTFSGALIAYLGLRRSVKKFMGSIFDTTP
jgi:hypothetical protein